MFSSCASSPLPAPPLVFDLGVHTFRAGTSGDVLPRWIAPSVVGYAHDDVASSFFSSSPSFSSPTSYRGDAARRREARGMLLAPLNPLEKRDHLDVYPVVSCSLHPYRSPSQTTQNLPHLKSEGEDERGRAVVRMKEEDDPRVRTKTTRRDGRPSTMAETCRYTASGCGGVYYEVDIPVSLESTHTFPYFYLYPGWLPGCSYVQESTGCGVFSSLMGDIIRSAHHCGQVSGCAYVCIYM